MAKVMKGWAKTVKDNWIATMKEEFPQGTRLLLVNMNDPYAPVPSGTRGTVTHVDDMGQIHLNWDNGRTLAVVPEEDDFRKLTAEELAEEKGGIV